MILGSLIAYYQYGGMQQKTDNILLIDKIKKYLSENQSDDRYTHAVRTMECALKLNHELNLGLDVDKIKIAALLHDLAKEYPYEKYYEIAEEYDLTFDEVELRNPYLMHSRISAIEAERIFGIEDSKILSAIITHPTGADNMSDLDLLIYAADKIEAGRDYDTVNSLREEISKDFYGGCLAILQDIKQHVLDSGKEFHPDSDKAISDLKNRISLTDRETRPVLNGQLSPERRLKIAKSFVSLDRYMIICAIAAGFVAIVLTFIASVVFFVHEEWQHIGHEERPGVVTSDKHRPYSSYFDGRKELLFLICGLDEVHGRSRTDTIILARLDFTVPQLKMVSIPRDTFVKIPTSRGGAWNRINSAYVYGGEQRLLETIENLIGHYPDFLILVDYDGFINAVDLVGGVEIDVDRNMRYNDYAGGVHIDIQKGFQRLDGKNALDFVRYRQYHDGDFSRIRNQHKFLKAFKDALFKTKNIKKLSNIVSNMVENVSISRINLEIEDELTLEKGLEFNQYMALARAFQDTDFDDISISTLKMVDYPVIVNGQDVLVPDYAEFDFIMQDLLEN